MNEPKHQIIFLKGGGTGSQAVQAAQAKSIMTAGSAGQQYYGRRQRRPTALWPQAVQAIRNEKTLKNNEFDKKLLKMTILTKKW